MADDSPHTNEVCSECDAPARYRNVYLPNHPMCPEHAASNAADGMEIERIPLDD